MKLRRTTTEAWGILRTVTCILVAVLIFLISFPSFAAEESSTEVVPDTEAAISEDEITEEKSEEDTEDITETDPLPEKTRINVEKQLSNLSSDNCIFCGQNIWLSAFLLF